MISFCLAFARPCYYTTSSCVCQPLFSTFLKKFFRARPRFPLCYSLALLAVSLHIILHTMSFCQELFLLFSPFFTFLALQTVFVRHFVRLFGRLVCIFNNPFGTLRRITPPPFGQVHKNWVDRTLFQGRSTKNYFIMKETRDQISGISISISRPTAADFAIPSMIAWLYRI